MARPCDHPTGPPRPETGCVVCILYVTRADHRELYDRGQEAPPPPAARPPAPAALPPCPHLGPPTGEARECRTCGGHVRIKLRACALHGACTEATPLPGVRCCGTCRDRPRAALAPRPAPPPPPARPAGARLSVLITGGIGDLFALEGLMAADERAALAAVFYACPAAAECRRLMAALPNYPNLRHHLVLATGSRTHYTARSVEGQVGRLPAAVEDWSIGRIFPQRRAYAGSSFLAHRLAAPELPPAPYVVVVPHSTWGQWAGRNFDAADWRVCLDALDRHDLRGVVLCRERLPVPEHPRLLDWQGRTSILESVEVLKGATGYLGIDSNLSVLAAKLFPPARLSVKGFGPHLLANLPTYYAPHAEFPFVRPALETPPWT